MPEAFKNLQFLYPVIEFHIFYNWKFLITKILLLSCSHNETHSNSGIPLEKQLSYWIPVMVILLINPHRLHVIHYVRSLALIYKVGNMIDGHQI